MLNALKSARAQQPSLFPYSLQNHIARKPSGTVRFVQATAGSKQPDSSSDSMDQKQDPKSKTGDTMTSFGEGYATRSDEEGFGGIYGGNQYVSKETDDKNAHADAPEFDHNQGSEVKEKEKARNQSEVAS